MPGRQRVKRILTDAGRSKSSHPNETKDCAVRALATALDWDYDRAHKMLKRWGRKDRKTTYHYREFCKQRLRKHVHVIDVDMSVAKFMKMKPKGSFIVHVTHHALCLKDGVFYDDYHRYIPTIEWVARVRD